MLHVRLYVHSGMHFCRYFNELEKINTHIYIVFQIDKNITILTIYLTSYLTVLTNSYTDFFIYVRTAVIVYLTPNFCFT